MGLAGAPERVRQQQSDARSDIYSAGVMLFKMLVGVLPLVERNPVNLLVKKARDPDAIFTQKPSEVSSIIDKGLETVILRAIASDPAQRYQTCQEFDQALETYRDGM